MTRKKFYFAMRTAVALTLMVSAIAKAMSGFDQRYAVTEIAYYVAIVVEVIFSFLMWTSVAEPALLVLSVILFGISGFLWLGGLSGPESCGCFGAWHISRRQHFFIVGVLGAMSMAAMALGRNSNRREAGVVAS